MEIPHVIDSLDSIKNINMAGHDYLILIHLTLFVHSLAIVGFYSKVEMFSTEHLSARMISGW